MLDPWIIEKIRRREQERREDNDRGRVHIEVPTPQEDAPDAKTPPKEEGERGVVVIDL